jgi:FtsH-binding integral membrane protein
MSMFTSGIFGNGRTNILIWGIWGFLIILYIMYDFSVIKKSQPFMEMLDAKTQTKYVYLFGFMLFMNLIQLLWVLIRIMLSVRR